MKTTKNDIGYFSCFIVQQKQDDGAVEYHTKPAHGYSNWPQGDHVSDYGKM